MNENYNIRRVTEGDEQILAYIQTESWKDAFQHILEPEDLKQCTNLERATAMYQKLLDAKKGNGYILEVEGKPHCIAWWDAARNQDMTGYAELICIHSLQDNWRKGYGSKMMEQILNDMHIHFCGCSKRISVPENFMRQRVFIKQKKQRSSAVQ